VAIAWRSATEQSVVPDADNCGAGNTAAYGASSEFRRVVTVQHIHQCAMNNHHRPLSLASPA
jgi:hypothetical protein